MTKITSEQEFVYITVYTIGYIDPSLIYMELQPAFQSDVPSDGTNNHFSNRIKGINLDIKLTDISACYAGVYCNILNTLLKIYTIVRK